MPNKKITYIPGLFQQKQNQSNNSRSHDNPFILPEVLGACAGVCSPPAPDGSCTPMPVYALDDPLVDAIIDFSSECLENIAKIQRGREEREREVDMKEQREKKTIDTQVDKMFNQPQFYLKKPCPVKIPYKSTLTHQQHNAYLRAFVKTTILHTPIGNQEYQQYMSLQHEVYEEQTCFNQFSYEVSKLQLDTYNTIPEVITQYMRQYYEARKQRVCDYKRHYTYEQQVPIRPQDPSNKMQSLVFTHIGHLLSLGSVPRFTIPNKCQRIVLPVDETVPHTHTHLQTIPTTTTIQEGGLLHKTPVSLDSNACYLAQTHLADIVTTPSAIKVITDNYGPNFDKEWDIPVIVRSYQVKDGDGKERNHRVVFIDKPFPLKTQTPLEEKQAFYKKSALASLTHIHKHRYFKMKQHHVFEYRAQDTHKHTHTHTDHERAHTHTQSDYSEDFFNVTQADEGDCFGVENRSLYASTVPGKYVPKGRKRKRNYAENISPPEEVKISAGKYVPRNEREMKCDKEGDTGRENNDDDERGRKNLGDKESEIIDKESVSKCEKESVKQNEKDGDQIIDDEGDCFGVENGSPYASTVPGKYVPKGRKRKKNYAENISPPEEVKISAGKYVPRNEREMKCDKEGDTGRENNDDDERGRKNLGDKESEIIDKESVSKCEKESVKQNEKDGDQIIDDEGDCFGVENGSPYASTVPGKYVPKGRKRKRNYAENISPPEEVKISAGKYIPGNEREMKCDKEGDTGRENNDDDERGRKNLGDKESEIIDKESTDWSLHMKPQSCEMWTGTNIHYQLFTFSPPTQQPTQQQQQQNFKVIIRHHIHGISQFKKQKYRNKAYVVYPKLENQSYFGCEVNTLSEITQQYIDLLLRPNTNLFEVRVCESTGEVMLTQDKDLTTITKEGNQPHIAFSPQLPLSTLYSVFCSLTSLSTGQYLLHHSPNTKAFIMLLKAGENDLPPTHHQGHTLDLHQAYPSSSIFTTRPYTSPPWLAIDTHILTPFHLKHRKIPATFPMENFDRKLTNKERKIIAEKSKMKMILPKRKTE
ncbi:hypothetical protein Pmani_012477 [Petrolisthes manimaculis]|uniref:Little elongation complex subunit 2 C-terminal domain-containing protein n=1 Tax=Petrolisthes manimaculis TaxID=1843537 RepID=A0AAE1PXR0_9EUCA|nr:hypothetical protein Pmani_012477 [Petrolisthes manimaculis]